MWGPLSYAGSEVILMAGREAQGSQRHQLELGLGTPTLENPYLV